MDAIFTLIILSFIILLGAVGEFFFRKTGIPDALWLIIFGFVLATFMGLRNSAGIDAILPIFVTLTLIIILFDGGLNVRLGSLIKNSVLGSGVAFLYFILSTAVITGVTYLLHIINVLPIWDAWSGVLLGAIVSGTSSVIVMPLVKLAGLRENISDMLSVESAFTDALCIVVVLTILNYLGDATQGVGIIFRNVAASFAIGIVLGIVIGLIWNLILKKLATNENIKEYFYVLTLSLLIFLYVLADSLGGSTALAIFTFGIVLGSSELLNKIFKTNFYNLESDIFVINKQIAFLIKSFFFVLIGLLFVFVFKTFWIALLVSILLLGTRWLTINIPKGTREYLPKEKKLIYFFAPKGLAAGILAITISQSTIVKGANLFGNIVFSIIIISILFATVSLFVYKKIIKADNTTTVKLEKEVVKGP